MTPNLSQHLAIYGTPGIGTAGPGTDAALRVVIAGPGSGKTFTLTECVKWHIATDIIAVMTFTNGTAYEHRKRLGELAQRLAFIGTTHSYCFKLIQRFGHLIGYKSGQVAILPDGERIPRLLAVRDKLGITISQQKLLAPLSDLDEAGPLMKDVQNRRLIFHEYEFLLKRNNLVDFDGMLRDGAKLLFLEEVREQIKLDWLFVDERQDSSREDQLIYDLIPAAHKFYVGDADQCIYVFRGADPEGLVGLTKIDGAEVIKLEYNYRSDITICVAANNLIGHNKMRVDKKILPVSRESGVVAVFSFEDTWQELFRIDNEIRNRLPANYSVAVLCRLNYEVDRCYKFFIGQGLPVKRQRWVEHPPDWGRALLLLSLCASPDNEILTERYLKLDNPSAMVDQWLLESRAGGTEFGFRIRRVLEPSLHKAPRFLAENGVGEITINAIKQRAELLPPDATLSDLLQDLYAHEDMQREETDEGIHVGTMHSAKGREWDVVFLPAFEEGVIPNNRSMVLGVSDNDEEERRLAFVAVTRAKHELYISWSAKRQFQWGGVQDMQPSRFIGEMGL